MRDWPSHKCRTCKNFSYHRQLQGIIDIYKVSSCKINLREINLHVDNAFCINLSRDQLWQNQSRWDQLASMGIQVNGLPVSVFVELNRLWWVLSTCQVSTIYISMLLQLDHINTTWNRMAEFITTHQGGKALDYQGYIYTKIWDGKEGLTFWRCQDHKSVCLAVLGIGNWGWTTHLTPPTD